MKEIQDLLNAAKEEYGLSDKEKNMYDFSWDVFEQSQELVLAAQNKDVDRLKTEIGNLLLSAFVLQSFCENKHGIQLKDSLNASLQKINERKPKPKEQKMQAPQNEDGEEEIIEIKARRKTKK